MRGSLALACFWLCILEATPLALASGTPLPDPSPIPDSMIEVGAPPAEIHPIELSPGSDQSALIRAWVKAYGKLLPIHPVRDDQSPVSDPPEFDTQRLVDFLGHIIQFIGGFKGGSDDWLKGDFSARFVQAVNQQAAPGIAWVLEAFRTEFDRPGDHGYVEGGSFGLQFPLLGSRNVQLQNNEGHVVLRLMPLGGDYEAVTTTDPKSGVTWGDYNTGIVVRPSAELELQYRGTLGNGVYTPGVRVLISPKLVDPSNYRLLAEVYVKIDVDTGNNRVLSSLSIVPRCILQFNSGGTLADQLAVEQGNPSLSVGKSAYECMIDADIGFRFM
ncbi:MAG: hypothetical protein ACXWP5_10730 [Bdellovibrionota bacterium]